MCNNGSESVLPNRSFILPFPGGSSEEEFCGIAVEAVVEGVVVVVLAGLVVMGRGGGRESMAGVGFPVFTDSPGAAISFIPAILVVEEEEEEGRGRRGGPKSSVWGWEVSSTITSFPMEFAAL